MAKWWQDKAAKAEYQTLMERSKQLQRQGRKREADNARWCADDVVENAKRRERDGKR